MVVVFGGRRTLPTVDPRQTVGILVLRGLTPTSRSTTLY